MGLFRHAPLDVRRCARIPFHNEAIAEPALPLHDQNRTLPCQASTSLLRKTRKGTDAITQASPRLSCGWVNDRGSSGFDRGKPLSGWVILAQPNQVNQNRTQHPFGLFGGIAFETEGRATRNRRSGWFARRGAGRPVQPKLAPWVQHRVRTRARSGNLTTWRRAEGRGRREGAAGESAGAGRQTASNTPPRGRAHPRYTGERLGRRSRGE